MCPYYRIEQQGSGVIFNFYDDIVPLPTKQYPFMEIKFTICGMETVQLLTGDLLKYNLKYNNEYTWD